MTKAEFIAAATAAALVSSAISRFPAGVTVAQAALESNWGQSQLSTMANNYFGIKAHAGIPASIAMPTSEVLSGAAIHIVARFAKYRSMPECFADRDRIILRVAAYADARAHAADAEAFARALAKHWATDPRYADKLVQIYRENQFDSMDAGTTVA